MSERLVVDSIMTADGEVVPLGPVDKDGHRVPLDTTSLYGPRGEHYKVKSFVHFPLMDARSEYRDWHVPDGASVSAADFSTAVECAECGCWLAFGESYTSRLIHNELGFGYAVCPRCYEDEFREMGESCDL